MTKANLPPGLRDVLPPKAAHRNHIERQIIDTFTAAGYQAVSPPPLEFLESLDFGDSEALLKLADPVSHKMLALRNDFTAQMARIADASMAASPRPLRLCYCGAVVCAKGTPLHPGRFWSQAGLEVFGGEDRNAAVLEVITLGLDALQKCGVEDITLDLNYPSLEEILYSKQGKGEDRNKLRTAIARKTPGALRKLNGELANTFADLLELPPNPVEAATALAALPREAEQIVRELIAIGEQVADRNRAVNVTIDPLERRGFGYYKGITFSYFCENSRGEIGRGGHYMSGGAAGKMPLAYQSIRGGGSSHRGGEDAVGLSLFVDGLLPVCAHSPPTKIFAAADADLGEIRRLRLGGAVVITSLGGDDGDGGDGKKTAIDLGCTRLLSKKRLTDL